MTPEDKEAAMSEAVEVMARAMHDSRYPPTYNYMPWADVPERTRKSWRREATVALRALLSPSVTDCETCGGHGYRISRTGDYATAMCVPCNGSGQVTRPSIAVLRGELEHGTWNDDPELLYRIASD